MSSGEFTIIGQIAGAIIGNAIAPGFGTALGAAVGGYLGSTFETPPGQTFVGPRLSDLRNQNGSYGQMLPILYGSAMRVAGTVIFTPANILETGAYVTTEQSGQSTTGLQFSYTTSAAIALCDAADNPIIGVRKVWMNGQLVADYSASANLSVHSRSLDGAGGMRIYFGTDVQIQDPFLLGANPNESAYRKTAYVVILDLNLAPYGHLPNIEFEVVNAGTLATSIGYLDTPSQLGLAAVASIAPDGNLLMVNWVSGTSPRVTQLALRDPFTLQLIRVFNTGTLPAGDHVELDVPPMMNYRGDILFFGLSGTVYFWPFGFAPVLVGLANTSTRAVCDQSGNFYVCFENISSTAFVLARFVPGASTYTTLRTFAFTAAGLPKDLWDGNDGYLYAALGSSSPTIQKIRRSDGVLIASFTPAGPVTSLCTGGDGSVWYLRGSVPNLRRIAPDFLSETSIFTSGGAYTGVTAERLSQDWATGDVLWTGSINTAGGQYRYHSDGTPAGSALQFTVLGYVLVTHPNFPARIYSFNTQNAGGGSTQYVGYIRGNDLTVGTVGLDTAVTKICGRVGYLPADLDVTDIAGLFLRGYAIIEQQEARDMLMPLLTAFFVDMVESGGKLKFVRRSGVSVGPPITVADMGARLAGSEATEPYTITRLDETELPRKITLNYYDVDRDYQISSVYDRRQVTQSVNDVTMNLAIALTATEAQRIVTTMLYEAWAARTRISFSLSQKNAQLEPTDVKDVIVPEGTFTVRFVSKKQGSGIFQHEAVVIDASLYTQTAPGEGGQAGQTEVGTTAPTNLALLDTALLNELDDSYGFYVEAAGTSGGWAGTELFKSTDGGTTYLDTGMGLVTAATLGRALTILPDFAGGNVFDRASTVDVSASAALTSTTDLAVLNGANLAWLGGELIQFGTATVVSAGVYRLSGLLRGRMGTEWAMRRHVLGEVFALLSSAAYKSITSAAAEVGVAVKYKGVTFGTAQSLATAKDLTPASNRLKPLSPVQIAGTRDGGLNLTIAWKRRARKSAGWANGIEVPLDEPTEAYEVDVFAGTPKTLNAISLANPGVFGTTAVHGLVVNDIIFLRAIAGPIAFNDRAFYVASVPTTSTFTIRDRTGSLTGVVEDASIYPAWVSGGSVYKLGRTIAAVTTTASYTAAQQTTDYGAAQATVFVSAYQSSSRVGRGYGGTAAV